MQGTVVLLTVLHRLKEGRILKKSAVLNLFGDSGKLLVYNAPCTHIQMPYLRIPHLSVGKAHCHPAGIPSHKRAFFHQPIHHWCPGLGYGIALCLLIQPIAVQNH